MNTFEIIVIIMLYLLWAQRSKLVDTLAKKLTRARRKIIQRVKG